MAQIKNIKKPGDLIRGADVGIAALDKDGNVVGYKAAAADAGKVLTVGEDGSVAPAEASGSSLYLCVFFINTLTGRFTGNLITNVAPPSYQLTAAQFRELTKADFSTNYNRCPTIVSSFWGTSYEDATPISLIRTYNNGFMLTGNNLTDVFVDIASALTIKLDGYVTLQ